MRGCRNIPALEMTRFEMERGKLVRTIFFSRLLLYLSLSHARETFVDIKRISMMNPETLNLSVLSERKQA